jgi:site-specific DNA-methyltransferase (adenine-specific)
MAERQSEPHDQGRWPANLILDEEAGALLNAENDGGPSRFFYTAKAGRAEREAGLAGFAAKTRAEITGRAPGSAGLEGSDGNGNNPRSGANYSTPRRNDHPTVKPIDLMRYLCRLITPPGGTVLDPFCGSGSTGMAALDAGFDFIGTDLDPHYLAIAKQRAAYRHDFTAAPVVPTPTSDQGRLF